MIWSIPTMWQLIVSDVFATDATYASTDISFVQAYSKLALMLTIRGRLITPFILGSVSEHSDSSFVYGFMSLDYDFRYHDRNYLVLPSWIQ